MTLGSYSRNRFESNSVPRPNPIPNPQTPNLTLDPPSVAPTNNSSSVVPPLLSEERLIDLALQGFEVNNG
jgi:hypothetical protein